jgi:hypothetical protein
MNRNEWLDSLKVGDSVMESYSYDWNSKRAYRVVTIERMTKTLFITNKGAKYRKSNGYLQSGGLEIIEPVDVERYKECLAVKMRYVAERNIINIAQKIMNATGRKSEQGEISLDVVRDCEQRMKDIAGLLGVVLTEEKI